jgi:amyloid beta precursor protein binding protein 1
VLENDPAYLTSFTLVIAHNLETKLLGRLSQLLWDNPSHIPLVIVRSAGFLAEFFIQFHEHPSGFSVLYALNKSNTGFEVVESHSEIPPSLRIDKPFPALQQHALSLDFDNMDPTEHTHIPYVVILVHALEDWKQSVSSDVHYRNSSSHVESSTTATPLAHPQRKTSSKNTSRR